MVHRIGVVLLAAGPFGCFIPSGVDVDDFTGTDNFPWTESLTESLTATTIDSLTTTQGMTSTTVDPDTGTSDGGSTTSDTDDPPVSICDPQPEGVHTILLVDDMDGSELQDTDSVSSCAVTSVTIVDELQHVGMACADGVHTLDFTEVGELDLQPGDVVEFSLFVDAPFGANTYVALHQGGELVLAAMYGAQLPGDDGAPFEEFFAPLRTVALTEVCEIEPIDDGPCNFICPGSCTRDRRLALAFFEDDDAAVIYDSGAGELGELAIAVDTAVEHAEVFCTDVPGAYFEFIAVREP